MVVPSPRRLSRPSVLLALTVGAVVLLPGCNRGFPTPEDRATIAEETFVDAMAALRSRALSPDEFTIPEEERERILGERGVAWEELVAFAEVHGVDVPYMYGVWARVDSAIVARSMDGEGEAGPDGAAGAPTGDAPMAPR